MEVWIKFYLYPLALSFPDDGFSKMFFKICFFDTPPQGWTASLQNHWKNGVCVFFFSEDEIWRLLLDVGKYPAAPYLGWKEGNFSGENLALKLREGISHLGNSGLRRSVAGDVGKSPRKATGRFGVGQEVS